MDAQKPTLPQNLLTLYFTQSYLGPGRPGADLWQLASCIETRRLLLNFDANWYNYLYDADLKQQYEQDRRNVQQNDLEDHYLSTDIDADGGNRPAGTSDRYPTAALGYPHFGKAAYAFHYY